MTYQLDFFSKNLETTSSKVQKASGTSQDKLPEMKLPKSLFQPFFLKVMSDFIEHNKLPSDLPLPQGNMSLPVAMSCILDVISYSMGKEKRDLILQELEEYKAGLPFDLR